VSGRLKGLVSCIRRRADAESTDYFIAAVDGALRTLMLRSRLTLNVGELVEMKIAGDLVESFQPLESAHEREALEKEIERAASGMLKGALLVKGVAELDGATERMHAKLQEAMRLLARKLVIGAPIVVRFHNDVDGASGAYALHKAIAFATGANEHIGYKPNIMWRMHGSVSYTREDATADVLNCNSFECVEKPLLVILDFGTSEESNPGIEIVEKRFDMIWLDHHPIVEGFSGRRLAHYINPWNFGADSNYTAGFLACAFAKTLADINLDEVAEASLIGDYSEYSKPKAGSRRLAALLDLATSDTRVISGSKGNLTPEEIELVMGDSRKSDELIAYAENRVNEMLDLAVTSVKVYKAKQAQIYVLDFEGVRINEQERYPLPGRFASKLLGRIEELNDSPAILLLHFGSFVSARMSKRLIGRVELLKVLEGVRSEYSNYVESTGGHSNAASIKLKDDGMKKAVISAVVEKLKEEADKLDR
jgi:RecJ-like exonuclease